MTRCCKDNVNLKSSAYNQTGQTYVEQLSLHRSMCAHYRRVLLAKSVVDSKNPRYMKMMQKRCRPSSCHRLRFLDCVPSEETIDKLAYDSEHHPAEIIKVRCRSKSRKDRSCSTDRLRITKDINCPCLASVPCLKERLSGAKSKLKNQKQTENTCECKGQRRAKESNDNETLFDNAKSGDSKCCTCRSRKCKYEATRSTTAAVDQRQRGPKTGRRSPGNQVDVSCLERSRSASPAGETSRTPDEFEESFRKLAKREEDEARYAKFVYDITQEIVQNGLYTDEDLKKVFEKHLERSSALLNRRKMLYEIYQLKISLNMMDDSEDEDELEADLIFGEKFSKHRIPKPPTPPKVLDENKVLEKLESFKQQQEMNSEMDGSSSPGGKGVVLIDANPEFLVTERDVLSTLMDNHVNPEQIQCIYRNLYRRSKDMSLCEAVQVGSEVAYTYRLKQVDRCSSAISLSESYKKERSSSILRKESAVFNKKSPFQMSYHRYNYIRKKQNEALEKCEKWKMGLCNCKFESCKKHAAEKDKPASPKSFVEDKVLENKAYSGKKMKMKLDDQILSNNELKDPLVTSERSNNIQKESKVERRDAMSKRENIDARSVQSEETEEVEEEIESVIDELPAKSTRKSSISDDKEKFKEKKSSIHGDSENEESISTASESSDESIKYSDDVSRISESSSKKIGIDSHGEKESSTPKGKKVNNRRFTTMKDYFKTFTTIDDQKIWRISEGSSDSSTSKPSIDDKFSSDNNPKEESKEVTHGRVIKKRTSSGISGWKVKDSWNRRFSRLSNSLYLNISKYCDPKCHGSNAAKSCSDNCKFVRTNCRNLTNPTNCLNKVEKSESSDISDNP